MIKGIVAAVPRTTERNESARFVAATGVKERRVAQEGQTVLTLATEAARKLLQVLNWEPQAIIFVTQTPTVRMPCMAAALHAQLGLTTGCMAFDVNLACSGYPYGLRLAVATQQRVLLICGDTVTRMCNPEDSGTAGLFGDAVTATAVDATRYDFNSHSMFATDGRGFDKLIADPLIRMDGPEVFNFAMTNVPELLRLLEYGHADWFLFHQANAMMLRQIVKKCELNPEFVPMNLQRYGNTSSASIPLLMCDSDCTVALLKKTNRVVLCGFGAGWSMGGWVFDLPPVDILEVIEV